MITIGGKNISDISISNKNVIRIQDAETLKTMWEKTSTGPDYFYIENTYNGSNSVGILVSSRKPGKYHISELQYSTDKLNWTTYQLSNGSTSITLSQGQRLYFRNDNGYCNTYVSNIYWIMTFNPSQSYIVGGNINSLLDYTNMYNVSLPNSCYYELFNGSSTLTSSTDLTLSSTVSDNCYNSMFRGCTSLKTAPALPATTLAPLCYYMMFNNCTSLTTAPALPATTLKQYCYFGMFQGCDSLTTAPELPATTLTQYCYSRMFDGCTSLNSVTTYADDISASSCLTDWLSYVASSGTLHNLGSASYPTNSTSGIPVGWTEVHS